MNAKMMNAHAIIFHDLLDCKDNKKKGDKTIFINLFLSFK